MKVCSPPQSAWSLLRQPLTPGEQLVGDLLCERLETPWELYVQPHLNGLRPDFVLLHPQRGVLILEVKDWSGKGPHARSLDATLGKAEIRRQEVSDLYCPSLGKAYRGRVASRIILPFLAAPPLRQRAAGLDRWSPSEFVTKEDFPDLSGLVDRALPKSELELMAGAAADLRRWLIEPDFNRDQRRPIVLDRAQRSIVVDRPGPARRRIIGSAGSGKTQVLAARAAQLARQGRRVLVLTYNVTLVNYLRDLAVRWPDPAMPSRDVLDRVTWLNFHQWCKRIGESSPRRREYKGLWRQRETALDDAVAELTAAILSEGHSEGAAYDAVLIDECQDFRPSWLKAAAAGLQAEGQLWVAYDLAQDIYRQGEAWPKNLFEGLGFRDWKRLKGSYRLPPALTERVADFARSFLGVLQDDLPEKIDAPELALLDGAPTLRWIQIGSTGDVAATCFQELWSQLPSLDDLAVAELTFLCSTHRLGLAVVGQLEDQGVHVRHTFHLSGKPPRSQRMAFFKGDARVKGTTLHSFKGWESRALLLHIGKSTSVDALRTAYTGLTRLKRSPSGSVLTVICEASRLEPFGRSWPFFEQR